MPRTIDAKFDASDLPEWAQAHPEVVAKAERNLAYRADVCSATTDAWRDVLIRQAGAHDERVQLNVRIPASLYQRVQERTAGQWGGLQAFVEEALERALPEEDSMDRVAQVNWLHDTARDIVDSMSTEDAGTSGEVVVSWWLENAETPKWFDDHDRQLLVELVEERL